MRQAFADALRSNPSHPLAPSIARNLKKKAREYGGWTTNARGDRNVKRRR
jgi:hypothetical protein